MSRLILSFKLIFLSLAIGASYSLFYSHLLGLQKEPISPNPYLLAASAASDQAASNQTPPAASLPTVFSDQSFSGNNETTTVKNKIYKREEPKYFQADIPILMYHYIEEAPTSTKMAALYLSPLIFEEQLQAIKDNNYNTIFVSEAAVSLREKKKLPSRSLALTFDDGYEDFYDNVFPLLKKYDIKATLYVIVNRLEHPGYINEAELKEMVMSRFIEIGSHTFNHPDLKLSSKQAAEWEIGESKKTLSNIIGRPVLTIAYPFGRYNYEDVTIASSTGYLGAVSVDHGFNQSVNNLYLLKRLRPDDRRGPVFAKWLNRIFTERY
ncbi:MAG: polysaccharide deacetylase family protein [Patescibacteria group bacterium]